MPHGAQGQADGGVLITGATGFVGREVLTRYLEQTDRTVYALVRADDAPAADKRLRDGLRSATGSDVAESPRLVAVPGEVSDVIHSAASVSFALPLDESRAINVEGTRNVVDFADQCADRGGLHRLCYVSTAYVAGTHEGEFGEDDLAVGQEFRNPYEESKFEAERLVRIRGKHLPVQIVRPSIVVGEKRSGWTGSFNVLYAPLKAFVKAVCRRSQAIPRRPSTSFRWTTSPTRSSSCRAATERRTTGPSTWSPGATPPPSRGSSAWPPGA